MTLKDLNSLLIENTQRGAKKYYLYTTSGPISLAPFNVPFFGLFYPVAIERARYAFEFNVLSTRSHSV